MAESITSICNQGLGVIGSLRINDFSDATEASAQAVQSRLHYEPTKKALLCSYWWPFASDRATLSADATDPAFEWDKQFILPTDYLAMKSIYENRFSDINIRSIAIEGKRLLTNETTMQIRYIKNITDASKFNPLFVQLLVLTLADKFIGPLAGGDARIQKKIDRALAVLTPEVRALSGQESNTAGRLESSTWNDARWAGRDPARL